MGAVQTLHELVQRAAADRPDHVAVEDPERNSEITYGALDQITDTLSEMLSGSGIASGDRVGIYSPKSIGSFAALFGVLKSGAAYVPVDPSAPPQRNAFIFQDCAVRAIVVAKEKVEGLREAYGSQALNEVGTLDSFVPYGVELVVLQPSYEGVTPTQQEAPDRLAYILYTSGSTGKPKGVIHTHDSALSFVSWCSETFEPNGDDRFSSHAPFHFDLSILDIYLPMMHGATSVLIGEDLGKQPHRLGPTISERKITSWYSTPSILRLLVEYGGMENHDYSALRIVHYAGEVFPIKHLRALTEIWPHPRYFNLYGPTETNVCTYCETPARIPDTQTEPFPIGTVCSNDRALVMDENDREVPRGEEGELYITGGSVMQGYWNLPDRTATAFFVDKDGTRWYKTGDVVREEENGVYLFVGRRDRMVKRRGYRVELGEIEAALYKHPSIQEAAVLALPDEQNGVVIKAFLSSDDGEKRSMIEMKQHCAANLPLYMVPDRFSFHPALPKTSTDKIDYQGLKQLD